ncbi:hypothetical protein BH24CHL8_BH24CHL8_05680 [soil metagenome]
MRLLGRLVDRIAPALLMASGVTLLAAGLFSYAEPVLGDRPIRPDSTPGLVAERPDLLPSVSPSPTLGPSSSPSAPPSAPPSLVAPDASIPLTPAPTQTPSPAPAAVATRVVIPSELIDLPVISRQQRVPDQGPDLYPPCDVAIFHDAFGQPGEDGSTYLYAHAREGMFLPLLEASERQDGASLLGALVEVYTAADRLFVYEIFRVRRHALDFSLALDVPPGEQRLVLQTSEGPRGTVPKLQVAARLVSELTATSEEAQPRPRPVACYGA